MDWWASKLMRPLEVLSVSMSFVAGCASEDGQPTSFTLGWLVLSALVFCMLFLFIGLLRYLKGGNQPPDPIPPTANQFMEYQYRPEDEEEG